MAIGDIHGDYAAFRMVMTRSGLIDVNGDWTGGATTLIQTGDIPDRGADSLRVIRHLKALQEQAPRVGGKVVAMVGNHEVMNIKGDMRYVHPGEYKVLVNEASVSARDDMLVENFDLISGIYASRMAVVGTDAIKELWEEDIPLGFAEHRHAWQIAGEIGAWVANNPIVYKAGNNLFVHGGISVKFSAFSLDEINAKGKRELSSRQYRRDYVIRDVLGPLWYRGLVRAPCAEAESGIDGASLTIEKELDIILAHFGVDRIVIGHTPSFEGIKVSHNGRVIQIDTGMSAHYKGTNSFLEITEEGVFANNDGVVVRIEDPVAEDPATVCDAIGVS